MDNFEKPVCPDCQNPSALDRRGFIRTAASMVAAGTVLNQASTVLGDAPAAPAARAPRPAEAMIRELYGTLSDEQRRTLVMPWNHGQAQNQLPTRLRFFNSPINRRIGEAYTQPQQELIDRILHAICSDEEGFRRISRNGRFDSSGSLQGCGANIFGDPTDGNQFAWVFTGHHLTVRCDGNSEPNAAFGGPMYYGHSADGYSDRNVWYFQTQSVQAVFDALNEEQRRRAVATGSPGEGPRSVQFRDANDPIPGIGAADLTADQRRLVETVMRDLLAPFRREDGDEVMQLLRQNGGLERLHLAFYRDRGATDNNRWHFWRLEGPGFVWNYRPLPHVHCFVNIGARST